MHEYNEHMQPSTYSPHDVIPCRKRRAWYHIGAHQNSSSVIADVMHATQSPLLDAFKGDWVQSRHLRASLCKQIVDD